MNKINYKKICNFIFEINQLKYQKNSGMQLIGVKDPFSIAGHVWRAAQIGYILACLEGDVNPEKVVTMIVVHDNGEARIGDKHKVAARYLDTAGAETKAFNDQADGLEKKIGHNLKQYFDEFEHRNTKEGIIAKDADWLEQAFQAKEYQDLGYTMAENWINNVERAIETKSAKEIIKQMKKTNFTDWWQRLKKMTYEKLYH